MCGDGLSRPASELQLESEKAKLDVVTGMHVYSVQPGVPKVKQEGLYCISEQRKHLPPSYCTSACLPAPQPGMNSGRQPQWCCLPLLASAPAHLLVLAC